MKKIWDRWISFEIFGGYILLNIQIIIIIVTYLNKIVESMADIKKNLSDIKIETTNAYEHLKNLVTNLALDQQGLESF